MTGPAPNPFPARDPAIAHLFLYMDGIDLTPWAKRDSLDNATLQFQQGSTESVSVELNHYVHDNYGGTIGSQPLPAIRDGMVPVAYIYRTATTEEWLWSGIVSSRSYKGADFWGSSIFTIDTPTKITKQEVTVQFFPQTDGDDLSRLRTLGHKWGHANFDFSLTGYTHNITFPLPTFTLAAGEPATDYIDRAVDVIIRDICTDPGNPNDTGYPVPAREWWWEGSWKNTGDFTQGIKWTLHIYAVRDLVVAGELSDTGPESASPLVYNYGQGETIKVDYNPVIRRVVVAGAKRQYQPDNMVSTSTPHSNLKTPSSGWARKVGGTDGAYDTTAVGGISHYSDFDFHWQIQETYLVHDNFHGDDQHPLSDIASYNPTDPGFPPGKWYPLYDKYTPEALHNNMCRRNNIAQLFKHDPASSTSGGAYVDARAATCIQRVLIAQHRDNMWFLGRLTLDPTTHVLDAAIMLLCHQTGGTFYWDMYQVEAGGDTFTRLNTTSHAAVDGVEIKVNYKYNQVQVYFNDVIDPDFTQESYTFNQHATLFAIGQYSSFGDWYNSEFGDFSVTDYWGDKGIGIGGLTTGTDWFWIGYGIVYNVNGTYTLVQGGTVKESLGVGGFGAGTPVYTYAALNTYQAGHGGLMPPDVPWLWADVQLAHDTVNAGFSYDDVYQMTTVRYAESDGSVKRKVQWWKRAGGAGAWVLLREERGINPDIIKFIPSPGTPLVWHTQVALKELGATFTNMASVTSYSNVFYPFGALVADMVPLQGEYPATGVIQHDRLNTYMAREKIAGAVFREFGNPQIDVSCIIRPQLGQAPFGTVLPTYPVRRGQQYYFRNRRAGWVNDGITDKRQLLVVRGIKRVEGGAQGKRPGWQLQLGNKKYSYVDPARTHLLAVGAKVIIPANLELPTLDGMGFFFSDPASSDQYYGDRTEIKVNAVGVDEEGDLPTFTFPEGVRSMQIPSGTLPPGTQYEAQHRTVAADNTPSAWSAKYTGTAPQAPAYARPFVSLHPIGDGSAPIAVPTTTGLIYEVQLNEACSLVAWALNINDAGGIEVDIQRASEQDRIYTGLPAFASLCGTGAKPNVPVASTTHANAGSDLRNWSATRADLKKGDWIRAVVSSVTTMSATLGTLALTFDRVRRI